METIISLFKKYELNKDSKIFVDLNRLIEEFLIYPDVEKLTDIINIHYILKNQGYFKLKGKKYKQIFKNENYTDIIYNYNNQSSIENKKIIKEIKNNYQIIHEIYKSSEQILKDYFENKALIHLIDEINDYQFINAFRYIDVGDIDTNNFIQKEINSSNFYFTRFKKDKGSDGCCYLNISNDENLYLINENLSKTYYTLIVIIHEFSHGYLFRKYGIESTSLFSEVNSYYNEFKYMKKLTESEIGLGDVIYNYYTYFAILSNILKKKINILNTNYIDNFIYVFGILVSFEFFEMYEIDKDKANFYIDYIFRNIKNYGIIEILKKTNISIEKLKSGETVKKLIKKYDNLRNKTNNI